MSDKTTKVFLAEFERISEMLQSIDDWGKTQELDSETVGNIKLTIDELVANHCRYNTDLVNLGVVKLTLSKTDDMVCLIVEDQGEPFDPLLQPSPDCSVPFEDRKPGGLGLHLIRQISERLEYSRERECNILTVCFRTKNP